MPNTSHNMVIVRYMVGRQMFRLVFYKYDGTQYMYQVRTPIVLVTGKKTDAVVECIEFYSLVANHNERYS